MDAFSAGSESEVGHLAGQGHSAEPPGRGAGDQPLSAAIQPRHPLRTGSVPAFRQGSQLLSWISVHTTFYMHAAAGQPVSGGRMLFADGGRSRPTLLTTCGNSVLHDARAPMRWLWFAALMRSCDVDEVGPGRAGVPESASDVEAFAAIRAAKDKA